MTIMGLVSPMKRTILLAMRSARPGLTLLAALSITLFCASAAKAANTIPITSNACNYNITAPGDYTLESDIGPCGPGDAGILIILAGSNVTLHLNGHTINGSAVPENCDGAVGILAIGLGFPNITGVHVIGPGTLSNWQLGFFAESTSSSSVSNTKVTAHCTATTINPNNNLGFFLDPSTSQWTLLGNVVEAGDNFTGIVVEGNGNYIAGNRVNDTIVFDGSSNNYISGNNVNGTSLVLIDSSNNVVFGNFAINDSDGSGIFDFGGSGNSIISNTTVNNKGGPGIWLTGGSTGELVTLNRSLNNTPYDLEDDSPGCGANTWQRNTFKTASQPCIH